MKDVTEVLLVIPHEDRGHIHALLGRMATWGMLTYYDMDTVFSNVEEFSTAFFMIFPKHGMDWVSFCTLMEQLAAYEERPLRNLRTASFLLMSPRGPAFFDFRLLQEAALQA